MGTTTEILNLIVDYTTSNTINQSACDTYTWAVNGQTYTTSGTYTDVSTNSNGCSNTEILNLTINNSTTNTSTQTVCDTYTWAVNGQTYTTSGTYTDVTTNSNGCSNTEILNLTVDYTTSNTTNQTACISIHLGGQCLSDLYYKWNLYGCNNKFQWLYYNRDFKFNY